MKLAAIDNERQSCYVFKSVSMVTLIHLFMLKVSFSYFHQRMLMVLYYLSSLGFRIE